MVTLLKAYLMGSDDPFVLAKAYYDEIKKDTRAVSEAINNALPFFARDSENLEKDLHKLEDMIIKWQNMWKVIQQNAKEMEDTTKKIEYLEGEFKTADWEEDTFIDTKDTKFLIEDLFVRRKDIPGYIESLKDELSDAEQALRDLTEKRLEISNKIVTRDGDIDKPTMIDIHKLGLEMLQEQLDYNENLFQTLKDNKEIPKKLPKDIVAARKAIESKKQEIDEAYRKVKERHMEPDPDLAGTEREGELQPVLNKKARHMKEYRKLLGQLDKLGSIDLPVDSPEWRFEYYTNKISKLKNRIKESKEKLKEYGVESEIEDSDENERNTKAKEMGLKGGSTTGWFKRIKPESEGLGEMPSREKWGTVSQKLMESKYGSRKHGTHIPPEHAWEKEYYVWNPEKKTFELAPEQEKKEYDPFGRGKELKKPKRAETDFRYSDPEWFKLLARTSKPTANLSKDKFEQALDQFFRKDRPEFNKKPIEGKTPSGMGQIQYAKDAKGNDIEELILERPSIRLKNLEELFEIFQLLPDEEKEKGAPSIIIDALRREIGVEKLDRARGDKKGKDFNKGNIILKELQNILSVAKNKVMHYSDDTKPLSNAFLKEVSKIRRTMLTLEDIKNFANGIVASNQSHDNSQRESHRKRMLITFNPDKIDKITELLNHKNKSGKQLVDLITKAWNNPNVFNPKTKRTKEESQVWRKLADKFTGDLIKVIDRNEGIVREKYEGLSDAEFEAILGQMQDAIKKIQNSKNEERTEELIEELRLLYNNMGEIVRKVSTKVSKNSEEWKTLVGDRKEKGVYAQISDEIMNIPELVEKMTDVKPKEWRTLKPQYATDTATGNTYVKGFEKEFSRSAHKEIDSRRAIVEFLQSGIASAKADWKGENPYQYIIDMGERKYVESMLPLVREIYDAKTKRNATKEEKRQAVLNRRKSAEYKRNRLIERIINRTEIADKHLFYDDEPLTKGKRTFGQTKPDAFAPDEEASNTEQQREMEQFKDIGAAGDEPDKPEPEQSLADITLEQERRQMEEETGEEIPDTEDEEPEPEPELTEEEIDDREYEEEWDDYGELADRYERMGDDY